MQVNIFNHIADYLYFEFLKQRGKNMNNLNKDIFVSMLFLVGIFGFISGQFIVSTVVFAGAAVFSNINFAKKQEI